MAMLRMQAEMKCHYFPGYCSNVDLNLNANYGFWPLNTDGQILMNGQYRNVNSAPSSPDQYLAYKENLKQTILKHEAIFKDQVHELHRLYRRQKELMDEMKRIWFHRHQTLIDTSQSNQILCGPSSEYSQKTHTVSALPWMNPACSQSSVAVAGNNLSHLNYVEGKLMHVGCITVQTEGSRKEPELFESKCKKVGKKILDLELPADEYIDSEQEESLTGETVSPEVLGYPMKSIADDAQKSDLEPSSGIDDGNLVSQDDDVIPASFSRKTNCLADLNEPIKLEETNVDSNDLLGPIPYYGEIMSKDLFGNRKSHFQVRVKETIQGTQTIGDPAVPEDCSNVLDLEKNESQPECLSHNDNAAQSSSDMNFLQEKICKEMIFKSSSDDKIEQDHDISTPHLLNLNRQILDKKRKHFDLESHPAVKAPHTVTSSELIPLDVVMTCDSSWKKHTRDYVRAPIAVQALPCFNNAGNLNRRSKPKFSSTSDESNLCNTDNEFASKDNGTKMRIKDSVGVKLKRVIDLNESSPNCSSDGEEKIESSTGFSPLYQHLEKSNKKLEFDCNSSPDSEEQLTAKNLDLDNRQDTKSSGFVFHFDLNSWMHEDESLPVLAPLAEIDLQAPVSPENKESSPPRGESDENQLETPCQLPGQENYLLEDLMLNAAEALVSISSSQAQNYAESDAFEPSAASQDDSLCWFAKIASNIVDDPENRFGISLSFKNRGNDDECLYDGLDYFEAMTLNLKETNVEEYCKTNVQKEAAACLLPLPSQPRRGRRRQQRKDFQSEILPSLASLSRYEVTEDLQAIGGLIEAAHQSSCTGKTDRTAWTRVRRRRNSISFSHAETSTCTMLKQQIKQTECRIEERNLVAGWGKITRRRRGQRCPASKPRLILGEV